MIDKLQIAFWILAIITYLVLLVGFIYNFVNQVKSDRAFKDYQKRQLRTLEALENDINSRKGDK